MKLLPLLFLLIPLSSHAELNVIADLGGDDAAPYFEPVNKQPGINSSPATAPRTVQAPRETMLPVQTPEMTPGNVISRSLNLPGIGALFLVGDDEMSRTWLEENAQRLSEQHAVGMLVNVDSAQSVDEIQSLIPDIPLAPASGSELARRLQLHHYPVLITDSGLSGDVE